MYPKLISYEVYTTLQLNKFEPLMLNMTTDEDWSTQYMCDCECHPLVKHLGCHFYSFVINLYYLKQNYALIKMALNIIYSSIG